MDRGLTYLLLPFALLAVSGCSAKYDYIAETKVSETVVRVGLKHSHPYLAEYKKFLETEYAGTSKKIEIFPDSGGYAWVALIAKHGALEIRDFGGLQDTIPLGQKADAAKKYLGRFDFDRSNRNRIYRFIPASEDPHEPVDLSDHLNR